MTVPGANDDGWAVSGADGVKLNGLDGSRDSAWAEACGWTAAGRSARAVAGATVGPSSSSPRRCSVSAEQANAGRLAGDDGWSIS